MIPRKEKFKGKPLTQDLEEDIFFFVDEMYERYVGHDGYKDEDEKEFYLALEKAMRTMSDHIKSDNEGLLKARTIKKRRK